MNQVKVLLINKFHYRKGGSETYYFTLADALRACGHQVIFFSMQDEEHNLPCDQAAYFAPHVSVDGGVKAKVGMVLHMTYSRKAYACLRALLEQEKPDLAVLNLIHKHLTLSVIDAIRDYDPAMPIFWTMHDLIAACPAYTMLNGRGEICQKCLDGDFRHCVQERCARGSLPMSLLARHEAETIRRRGFYHKVDLFLCPSRFYQDILTRAGFTSAPIVTLRNPLPLDTLYERNEEDDGYVLYFGRLIREKGVGTLIQAARQTGRPVVICGTGPDEAEYRRQAEGLDQVVFKGFRSGRALTDFIRRSRCVALPSQWYENGPYSAMEAMALGKPLVVSDNGGLPELAQDGVNGFVYPAAQGAEGLAGALEKLFCLDKTAYGAMCRASMTLAQSMFDPYRYVEQLMKYAAACRSGRQEQIEV